MEPNNFTNNTVQPPVPGQAAARRIGGCVTFIILLCAFVFVAGILYFSLRKEITTLVNSISLQFHGVTTTGTVTSTEQFSNGDPSFPSSTYKLTVSFEVDGKSYSVKGSAYYNPLDKDWVGEPMPIIYDPKDPNIAFIDNFEERWLDPITEAAP